MLNYNKTNLDAGHRPERSEQLPQDVLVGARGQVVHEYADAEAGRAGQVPVQAASHRRLGRSASRAPAASNTKVPKKRRKAATQ